MRQNRDLAFANDISAALDDDSPAFGWALLLTIAALMIAALLWARSAVLDEVTTGAGRVIPSQQLQVAQSLEGGIVRELLVREGDQVEKDQILMRIDDTGFSSKLGEVSQRQSALKAETMRLQAEAEGRATVSFPDDMKTAAPGAVKAEADAFKIRAQKLEGEIGLLRQQLLQREQEVNEIAARRRKIETELVPLRSELELNQRLARSGNVAKVDVLKLQRQVAELDGDLRILVASLPRAQAAIAEAKNRIDSTRNAFRSQVVERLSTVNGDLAVIEETMKGAVDRVTRTTVRSPVRGAVNKLAVTTLGAVVQPGQPLAEIVPADEQLLLETRVRPKDIAFIRPEQPVSVKFTAYDYVIYGSLKGKVDRISPDTSKDERGEPFYLVIVRTEKNHLGTSDRKLPILPGLIATVDIQTGTRTVMNYLLKPVLRARHEAMRER
jgi:membrane fusion protein, adhesin transport system